MSEYGIIIISRDRTEMLQKTLPAWEQQEIPILIMTEKAQVPAYRIEARRILGRRTDVGVIGHPEDNKGVGYARESAVNFADAFGVKAFIMADDDTIVTKGSVRSLLDFVAKERGIVCAGWMPNYGLWLPDGNRLAKQPGLVIPRGASPDRVFALNTALVRAAGNFNPQLTTLDTQEVNRRGIRSGYMWYVHTSVHLRMLNKPHDPGGIQALARTAEERARQNQVDHEITYKEWGERYISHPSKRMATKWRLLASDFIGEHAAEALRDCRVYPEDSEELP